VTLFCGCLLLLFPIFLLNVLVTFSGTNSSRRAVFLEEENAQLEARVAELEALVQEQREKERVKGRKAKQNAAVARRAARK
jgi:Tfp pilus assembly protein PilN